MDIERIGFEIIKQAATWITPTAICQGSYCNSKIYDEYHNTDSGGQENYCTSWVSIVLDDALGNLGIDTSAVPHTAGASDFLAKSKSKGLRIDKTPKPGCVFYRPRLKNQSAGVTGHVGIVVKVDSGNFYTIEANTSFTWQGTKYNGVWGHYRPFSKIATDGFNFIHIEELNGTDDLVTLNYGTALNKDVAVYADNFDGGGKSGFQVAGMNVWLAALLVSAVIGTWAYNDPKIRNKYITPYLKRIKA